MSSLAYTRLLRLCLPLVPLAAGVALGPELLHSRTRALAVARSDASPAVSTAGIPNTVFLTGPWYPEQVIEESRQFVPDDTEFRFYDYNQVRRSARSISHKLESVGVHGVGDAWDQLRPIAYRADLWRLMILWDNGGYYLDAKMAIREPVSKWVDAHNDSFVVCKDVDWGTGTEHYWNGFFAARPKEPLLLDMIQRIVANVESRYYGPRPLSPADHPDQYLTGAGVVTQVVDERGFHPRLDCQIVHEEGLDHGERIDARIARNPENTTLMVSVAAVHASMRECSSCNSYLDLFQAHAVYCDEEAPAGVYDPCATEASAKLRSSSGKR